MFRAVAFDLDDTLAVTERDRTAILAEAGQRAGLRVRPKAVDPPRTLAFVESGAEVKHALRVVRAVGEAVEESGERT